MDAAKDVGVLALLALTGGWVCLVGRAWWRAADAARRGAESHQRYWDDAEPDDDDDDDDADWWKRGRPAPV